MWDKNNFGKKITFEINSQFMPIIIETCSQQP
jgi:hypothetical protein